MLSKLLVFVLSSIILQKQRWNVSNATLSTSAYCAVNLTMTSLDLQIWKRRQKNYRFKMNEYGIERACSLPGSQRKRALIILERVISFLQKESIGVPFVPIGRVCGCGGQAPALLTPQQQVRVWSGLIAEFQFTFMLCVVGCLHIYRSFLFILRKK